MGGGGGGVGLLDITVAELRDTPCLFVCVFLYPDAYTSENVKIGFKFLIFLVFLFYYFYLNNLGFSMCPITGWEIVVDHVVWTFNNCDCFLPVVYLRVNRSQCVTHCSAAVGSGGGSFRVGFPVEHLW